MSALTYAKQSGVWRQSRRVYAKQSGVWRDSSRVYAKQSGVWRTVFIRGFTLSIAADTNNYNIHDAAVAAGWDGVIPISVTLTLQSGIYLRSTSTSNPALRTGTFPSGSDLTFINLGFCQGKGGAGGVGGFGTSISPTVGLVGGDAILLDFPLTIDNGSGYILGGGGGGGGGAGSTVTTGGKGGGSTDYGGGGGGGGAGTGAGGAVTGGGGVAGSNGLNNVTVNGFGAGGAAGHATAVPGAAGGDWGAAGGNASVSGGAAGKAINRGVGVHVVTFLSGNDGTHVKGAVS